MDFADQRGIAARWNVLGPEELREERYRVVRCGLSTMRTTSSDNSQSLVVPRGLVGRVDVPDLWLQSRQVWQGTRLQLSATRAWSSMRRDGKDIICELRTSGSKFSFRKCRVISRKGALIDLNAPFTCGYSKLIFPDLMTV